MGACPGPTINAFLRTGGTGTGRAVVGTNVGLVCTANEDETGPKSAGEQIEEMAGTGVNVLTNKGRASLPDDATELVDGDENGGPTDILGCSGTRKSE